MSEAARIRTAGAPAPPWSRRPAPGTSPEESPRPGDRSTRTEGARTGMKSVPRTIDPFQLELLKSCFDTIADDMALTLMRTAHSGIVRDSLDFSTALLDADGLTLAQGICTPMHMGSFFDAMRKLIAQYEGRIDPATSSSSTTPTPRTDSTSPTSTSRHPYSRTRAGAGARRADSRRGRRRSRTTPTSAGSSPGATRSARRRSSRRGSGSPSSSSSRRASRTAPSGT